MLTITKKPSIVVANVDNQKDFDLPGWALYVPGAELAVIRAAKMINIRCSLIDLIISTHDTHREDQEHIFYTKWWTNRQGNHPAPFTEITYTAVLAGEWIPLFEKEWSIAYVKFLGSFTIWPRHCTEKSEGTLIVDVLAEAIAQHPNTLEIYKGMNRRTEWYGAFAAEFEDPLDSTTKFNVDLVKTIADYDLSLWFGQEGRHCVQRSLEQYLGWCSTNRPEAIAKMRYVIDCVNILDLGQEYKQGYQDFVESLVQKGVKVMNSTDPLY